jgi:hypothetical protein
MQSIKLSNNFLQSKVTKATISLGNHPLALLMFGPAGFYLDVNSMQLMSRFSSQVWKSTSTQFSAQDGLLSLQRYVQFLSFVVQLM